MSATTDAGMPGPLSATVISPVSVDAVISISGGVSASSAASSALSISSFKRTSGQSSTSWPVCATSSRREQNSARREVLKISRWSLTAALILVSW
jgi:hypothetical protein